MLQPFNLAVLLDMLTYARPSGSKTEAAFVAKYLLTLPGAAEDVHGNIHIVIGDSPILWSCHFDTVHYKEGRHSVHYNGRSVTLSRKSKRRRVSCLGADDTAGVFLCWSLINAGVPGRYVFHTGEEIGGEGSEALSRAWPESLSGVQFAIALDRKGYGDVITSQYGECASQAFAVSLAGQLNRWPGLAYSPSDKGVFTDTANYTGVVGECTNLSVGYAHAHSDDEWLDVDHLRLLLPALAALDPAALVAERMPEPRESLWSFGDLRDWREWRSSDASWFDYHSSVVVDGTFTASKYSADCQYCKLPFDPMESSAQDFECFCCADCEAADLYYSLQRRRRSPGVYLDSEFAEVQEALSACDVSAFKRRAGGAE